jgi:dihydroorotate dehydrogenase (NAD+) catalytic subunit
LIVKLTPNVTDVAPIARAVIEAGADAISLCNTFKARAKIRNGPNKGAWIEGGLSGPSIKPIALKIVSDLAKAKIGVPIVGIGGIVCLEDALDFFESGGCAVQIGTGLFLKPMLMLEIIDGLRKYLAENGFASFREFRESLAK